MTWVRVIRGDLESPKQRMETELEMFARLAAAEIYDRSIWANDLADGSGTSSKDLCCET